MCSVWLANCAAEGCWLKRPFEPAALSPLEKLETRLSNAQMIVLMRAVLEKGSKFRFSAPGGSMQPFIHNGDVITVAPLRGRPGYGDIVAFVHPPTGKLIVHRVVARRGDLCLMRGDAVPEGFDGWVTRADLLGRVARIERGGKIVRTNVLLLRWLAALLSRFGWLMPLQVLPLVRLLRRRMSA